MDLKPIVVNRLPSALYYSSRFPKWDNNRKDNVPCCFHKDNSPSLAINLNGGGARCHASSCKKRIGNVVHFESELQKVSEETAARNLYIEFIRKTLPPDRLLKYKQAILNAGTALRSFMKDTGLRIPSILRFDLGYDTATHRFIFPIHDFTGGLVNFRHYKPPSLRRASDKVKIYNEEGYGALELFPWREARKFDLHRPVFLMASEREVMLAAQSGLQAFCTTAGEGSWDDAWNTWVAAYDVIVCFDTDKGGIDAAGKIQQRLAIVAKSCRMVALPLKDRKLKDFADWVLVEKGNPSKLIALAGATKPAQMSGVREDSVYPRIPSLLSTDPRELYEVGSNMSLLGKTIRVAGIVSAKTTQAYAVPWKFKITPKGRTPMAFELPIGRDLLRFVRASDDEIKNHLASMIGNGIREMEVLAVVPVTEVEVIPIAVADKDAPYVVQRCYYVGNRIESNTPYMFEMVPVTEVRTQTTIGIITSCTATSSVVDNFSMTTATLSLLDHFRTEGEEAWDKIATIANEVSFCHTRVYDRLEWHLIALLTWLSPLQFRFPGEADLQRGWMNSLAIGDTQTGKSKVAQGLTKLFNCGVFVNSENCTYVGLVGGAIKMSNGQFGLRWGRIPLADRQLIVLEELTGMSVQDIGNMSEVRSAGIARLDKGGISGETNARTRLLCLSNPRSSQTLASYIFGVKALQQLVGHGEDLARFDLMTCLIDNEVSLETINSPMEGTVQAIPTHAFAALAQFVWALKPDQIHLTPKAIAKCYSETQRLAQIYHPSIPVFKGGSGRFKLARIANAIAAMCFNWNIKRQQLVVSETHVEAAVKLLELCYNKPSFGYGAYSAQLWARDKIQDADAVERTIKNNVVVDFQHSVVDTLIHASRFTRDELCAFAGVSYLPADQIISAMVRSHIIRKGEANVWELTLAGKKWLEQLKPKLKQRKRK